MPRSSTVCHTRPPLERMMEIHQLLAHNRFPNCGGLAQMFEVNTRTIKRDIEFMRDRFNLPIEYHRERRGYYYTQPVKQFPTVTLTQQELFALMVAQKAVAAYQGTAFAAPLQDALKRLAGLLDDRTPLTLSGLDDAFSFRPLGPEQTDVPLFATLTRALQDKKLLSFQYRRLAEKQWLRRRVFPCHLACVDHHWYLIGYDLQRKAFRTFALSRMKEARPLNQTYRLAKPFNAAEYLRDSFGVFKGFDDFEVVIEFDPWATDLLRGRTWHPRQEWMEMPGGGSRLRLRLNNIEEILGWVLSWGPHAMVVRPRRLADRVREAAVELLKKYPVEAPSASEAEPAR